MLELYPRHEKILMLVTVIGLVILFIAFSLINLTFKLWGSLVGLLGLGLTIMYPGYLFMQYQRKGGQK